MRLCGASNSRCYFEPWEGPVSAGRVRLESWEVGGGRESGVWKPCEGGVPRRRDRPASPVPRGQGRSALGRTLGGGGQPGHRTALRGEEMEAALAGKWDPERDFQKMSRPSASVQARASDAAQPRVGRGEQLLKQRP